MSTTYHKFLVSFAIVVLFTSLYFYFSNGLKTEALTPVSSGSSLATTVPTSKVSIDEQIAQDTAFISTLTSLTKIKIDTTIFSNNAFINLNDNTVTIEPSPTGRANPFSPVDGNVQVSTGTPVASPVITKSAENVTASSAVLNGLVSNTTGVSVTYFEFGITPALTKTTIPSKPSLIGTYVGTLSGLLPKTTYYYRAAAKINGNTLYGEVVSFTTN